MTVILIGIAAAIVIIAAIQLSAFFRLLVMTQQVQREQREVLRMMQKTFPAFQAVHGFLEEAINQETYQGTPVPGGTIVPDEEEGGEGPGQPFVVRPRPGIDTPVVSRRQANRQQ